MSIRLPVALALLSLPGTVSFAAQSAEESNPAQQADMRWLHLVDAGDYTNAWNSAAPIMRSAVAEPAFATSVSAARTPLGAPGPRSLLQAEQKTTLPGAPDGHYVIAQYTTEFAKKAHAIETVIAAQDPDGSWHVAGYFIR